MCILCRDVHDFDIKIKIMILNQNHDLILILNHHIFSDFDFKSSEISMIFILKCVQNLK